MHPMRPLKLLPIAAFLLLAARVAGTAPRTYEVQFAYVGWLSTFNPLPPECAPRMDPRGYDSLVGTLSGIESPAGSAEDVVYRGKAKRKTRIDHCLTKPKSASAPDELVYCVVHQAGAATMELELTVSSDSGKGAYLHAKSIGNADSIKVEGDCTAEEMNEMRADYPSGPSVASPDGQPIWESGSEFTVAGVRRLGVGSFPAKPPETAWGLRVLRAVP